MKVTDPGHTYELDWLDGLPIGVPLRRAQADGAVADGDIFENRLIFVKREGDGYPGNVGHHPGTNMQEVLRALIDRVKYLNAQVPDGRNGMVVRHLRGALLWLEDRAADRHGRTLDPHTWNVDRAIELEPACPECGHVGHAAGACRGGAAPRRTRTFLLYRCDHCLHESLVSAEEHRTRACDRTNCNGTQSPVPEALS
jgi:hypothetical protein